jgi:hypothetical protein
MTGPEHYVEAERQLELARTTGLGPEREQYHLAAAQVHATLALASGTVASPPRQSWGRPGAHEDQD